MKEELQTKVTQTHSVVLFKKGQKKWKFPHASKFQLSNPEFTQHYIPEHRLHECLHVNAKYTHQIFNQLQWYLLEKRVQLQRRGG